MFSQFFFQAFPDSCDGHYNCVECVGFKQGPFNDTVCKNCSYFIWWRLLIKYKNLIFKPNKNGHTFFFSRKQSISYKDSQFFYPLNMFLIQKWCRCLVHIQFFFSFLESNFTKNHKSCILQDTSGCLINFNISKYIVDHCYLLFVDQILSNVWGF